jgi:hypothetical protein
MTELELYKFIEENGIEYHWFNENTNVIIFVNHYLLPDWNKLLGIHILDEEGIVCRMKDGYMCFEMNEICDYFGIEISNVFLKENKY